jgi:hypothetical protein
MTLRDRPDELNMLLRSAHFQESLEPRPIHPEVEKQLRTRSHPSISVPETSFLDRALANILATSAEDDRSGVTGGSLHPRKKKKVYQETQPLHCTSIPQTNAIRRENTPEYSGFQKITTQDGTRKRVAVKHADRRQPFLRDKRYCDDSSVWEYNLATSPPDVIRADILQGVSKNASQAAVSCGDEHDVAPSMVKESTPPKIGHENYDSIDLPDPRSDTSSTHASPPAPWLSRSLLAFMKESEHSQSQLEDWDEDHGLPKSHCLTMVSSSRSRRQLQQGVILPKWDGTPLISHKVELGKPRKRRRRVTAQPTSSELHCESNS